MARIRVKVIPNATHDQFVGRQDEVYKFKLRAPPVDGKANQALCRWIADYCGCPLSAVRVVSGQTARNKLLELPDAALARMNAG